MRTTLLTAIVASATLVSGCAEIRRDKTIITDRGPDRGPLIDKLANIWTDPDGCQHWYIDDGVEGYMTPRLNPDGTPVCQGRIVTKDGTVISDS